MNAEQMIDWGCWEVEEPTAGFADRVMDAVQADARPSASVPRRARFARRTGMLAAAAVAAGSLTVLAMIGQNARLWRAPSIRTATTPSGAPTARSAAERQPLEPGAKGSTPARAAPPAEPARGTVVDRKLRDVVRARLAPPLTEHGVERDPHTGLTIPAGTSGPSHNLSRQYLDTRIREDFYPLAMGCYTSALAKQPSLRGQIVVDFMIVGDPKVGGIVDQAKINERTDIADAELIACIRESMLSMVFAPPDNNGWITVTYPFQFAPDDDDDEGAHGK